MILQVRIPKEFHTQILQVRIAKDLVAATCQKPRRTAIFWFSKALGGPATSRGTRETRFAIYYTAPRKRDFVRPPGRTLSLRRRRV